MFQFRYTETISRRALMGCAAFALKAQPPSSRRELFVDDSFIEFLRGAELRLGVPEPREIVLRLDRPHEGPFSAYFTVLQDDGRFRLYYRGVREAGRDGRPGESTCYAESLDGIHFVKPADNVILRGQPPFSHNF